MGLAGKACKKAAVAITIWAACSSSINTTENCRFLLNWGPVLEVKLQYKAATQQDGGERSNSCRKGEGL